MLKKKLVKILLSAACNPSLENHQRETPLDISLRKGFTDITQILRNPPKIITPIQRDEMRASKYKGMGSSNKNHPMESEAGPSTSTGRGQKLIKSVVEIHKEPGASKAKEKRSNSSKTGSKSTSNANLKEVGSVKTMPSSPGSRGLEPSTQAHAKKRSKDKESGKSNKSSSANPIVTEEVPKWSPYGCHYHPNPGAFPPPNIDSLPKEPLTTGELYYLDLAGNIHKVSHFIHYTLYVFLYRESLAEKFLETTIFLLFTEKTRYPEFSLSITRFTEDCRYR